jgi:ATP-binding cassette subfamily B protein
VTEAPSTLLFIRRMFTYLGSYRWQTATIALLLVLESTFGALIPLSLMFLIDRALVQRDRRSLLLTILFLAGAGLTISAAGLVRDYLLTRIQARVLSDIRARMFQHLQRLSLSFYARTQTGEILSRFTTDLASIESAMTSAVPWGILPGLDCLLSTVLLLALDWRLGLLAMLIWPWCLLVPKSLVPKVASASYLRKASDDEIMNAVQENLLAQPVVKAFALERSSIAGFLLRNTRLQQISIRVSFLSAMLERSAGAGTVVLQVLTMGVGAYMAFNGSLSIGTLASFQALFITLSYSLLYFTQYLPGLAPAAAGMERIEQLLSVHSGVPDAPNAPDLPRFSKSIEFQDVVFGYSESQTNLKDVSLVIPQGTSVALVGSSGSGKSTMLNLLLRFYDPNGGRIVIDGLDLRGVTQDSLRSQIGVVFQDSFLFNTTLRENIRVGRPSAMDPEIEAAAREAEIHDFIVSLPEGYSTMAGERGGRLSGGQRQRIAIARALLRDPAILLFDEATSALDPSTETALNETIRRAALGRTILSVTHRLASTPGADTIFVFDRGLLVERGCHSDLMASDGMYAHMWNKQSGFTLHEDGARVEIDIERLRKLPILADLENELLRELQPHFATDEFPEGRVIIHEGDAGNRLYIIVRGAVAVRKGDEAIAVLQDGDYFGEIALLKNSPRTATVQAIKPSLCVSLTRQTFMAIIGKYPQVCRQVTEVAHARLAKIGGVW